MEYKMTEDLEYKVSKIVRKGTKYLVFFNNQDDFLTLNEDQIVEYRIIVGNSFNKKDYQKIKHSEKLATSYNKVLHYIDFKPRTTKEVKDYLAKTGLSEGEITKIIKKLIDIKYLDDERYLNGYLQEFIKKAKGRNYIIQTLLSKGIDKQDILVALNNYSLEEERQNAIRVATKLITTINHYPLKKQQLVIQNHLLQDGFSYDIISYVLGVIELTDNSSEYLEKEYQKLLLKETDRNKIVTKLLAKGFDYSNIKKLVEQNKYN